MLLTVFAVAAYRLMPSMNRILMHLVSLRTYAYTIDILELSHQTDDEFPGACLPLAFAEEVSLSGLTYQFEDSDTPILNQFNLCIAKGEQLGIIGKSGSGKTTLVRLLLRLFIQRLQFARFWTTETTIDEGPDIMVSCHFYRRDICYSRVFSIWQRGNLGVMRHSDIKRHLSLFCSLPGFFGTCQWLSTDKSKTTHSRSGH